MNGLSLFSGIGGIDLALKPWVKTIAYCEADPYCQGVLMSRMREHRLDWAPIHTDVRELRGDDFSIPCDIIFGGFPCQDRSLAGARKGMGGERSSLFWEIVRLTDECRPSFVFVENPKGTKACRGDIAAAFDALGYQVREGLLSAAEIGADHFRERLFVLAYTGGARLERLELQQRPRATLARPTSVSIPSVWKKTDCDALRTDHELPRPMDEIRALGNAVVPLQAREAFKRLAGLK